MIDGILKGIYPYRRAANGARAQVQLWGSGPMLNEALRAQEMLQEKFGIAADVWSVTSYIELRRDAIAVERWNRLHPAESARKPYVQQVMEGTEGPIVASSDYMKVLVDQLSPWLGGRLVTLGTDGFGRSENREYLPRFFEIDAESMVVSRLAREGRFDGHRVMDVMRELGINPDANDPAKV
jgi:pyruvate dehydrogenase E1 component